MLAALCCRALSGFSARNVQNMITPALIRNAETQMKTKRQVSAVIDSYTLE